MEKLNKGPDHCWAKFDSFGAFSVDFWGIQIFPFGPPPPALCVEMEFYADISWESRCSIEINVWDHFYKILLVFEVPYWPQVKGMPGKS